MSDANPFSKELSKMGIEQSGEFDTETPDVEQPEKPQDNGSGSKPFTQALDQFEDQPELDRSEEDPDDTPFISTDPTQAFLDDDFLGSLQAGGHEFSRSVAGALEWAGFEDTAEAMEDRYKKYREMYDPPERVEYENFWEAATNPEWYERNVSRQIPNFVALSLPSLATGGTIGAASNLGKFGTAMMSGLGFSAVQTAPEAMLEAGATYQQAKQKFGDKERATEAANQVFTENVLALTGSNFLEGATALAPLPGNVAGRLVPKMGINAALEGAQETVQEGVIQPRALGEEADIFSDQASEARAIGAIMGAATGGAGEVSQQLNNIPDKVEERASNVGLADELEQGKQEARREVNSDEVEIPDSIDDEQYIQLRAISKAAEENEQMEQVVRDVSKETGDQVNKTIRQQVREVQEETDPIPQENIQETNVREIANKSDPESFVRNRLRQLVSLEETTGRDQGITSEIEEFKGAADQATDLDVETLETQVRDEFQDQGTTRDDLAVAEQQTQELARIRQQANELAMPTESLEQRIRDQQELEEQVVESEPETPTIGDLASFQQVADQRGVDLDEGAQTEGTEQPGTTDQQAQDTPVDQTGQQEPSEAAQDDTPRPESVAKQSREAIDIEGEPTPENITEQLSDIAQVPHSTQVIETVNQQNLTSEQRDEILSEVFAIRERRKEVAPGLMDEFDMLNSRHMTEYFDQSESMARAETGKEAREIGLDTVSAVFDLDNFGEFNEQYGHAGGDQVIRIFRDIAVDEGIYLHHFGGDEYAAPATVPVQEFRDQIQRVKQRFVEKVNQEFKGDLSTDVTVGIAENVALADFELMHLKENNRRGEIATSPSLLEMDLSSYNFSEIAQEGAQHAKQQAGITGEISTTSGRDSGTGQGEPGQTGSEVQSTTEGETSGTGVDEQTEQQPTGQPPTDNIPKDQFEQLDRSVWSHITKNLDADFVDDLPRYDQFTEFTPGTLRNVSDEVLENFDRQEETGGGDLSFEAKRNRAIDFAERAREVLPNPQEQTTQAPEETGENVPLDRKIQELQEVSEESDFLDEELIGAQDSPETSSYEPNAHFSVVEADELITSYDDAYPDNALQPRTSNRAELRSKFKSEFDPSRLGNSRWADDGAPIAAEKDSFVESGNLRVDILRNFYENNTDQAQAYKDWMVENASQFGLDGEAVSEVDNPILVRVREPDTLTTEERIKFADEANNPTRVSTMSKVDRARADADKITREMLQDYDTDFKLDTQQNEDFRNAFLQQLDAEERDALFSETEDGTQKINSDGLERIRYALIARAFDNVEMLDQLMVGSREGFKRIFDTLSEYSGEFVKVKQEAAERRINPKLDITDNIANAVSHLTAIKKSNGYRKFTADSDSNKSKLHQYMEQDKLFSRKYKSDINKDLVKILEHFGGSNGSKPKLRTFLDTYTTKATKRVQDPNQASLMTGDISDVPYSPEEVLMHAVRTAEAEHEMKQIPLPMVDKAIERDIQRYIIEKYEQTDEAAQEFVRTVERGFEEELDGEHGRANDGDVDFRMDEVKMATGGLSPIHLRYLKNQIEPHEALNKYFARQVTDHSIFIADQIDPQLDKIVTKVLNGEAEAEFTEEGQKRFEFISKNSPAMANDQMVQKVQRLIPALEAEGITETASILQAAKYMITKGGSQRYAQQQNRYIDERIDFSALLDGLQKLEDKGTIPEGSTERAREALNDWETMYEEQIKDRMRGNMSINEIMREALNIDLTSDEIADLAEGSTLNAEETLYVASMMVNHRQRIEELAQQVTDQSTASETYQEFQELLEQSQAVKEAWAATGSEWGRTGRMRQEAAKEVINQSVAVADRAESLLRTGRTPSELAEKQMEALHDRAVEKLNDSIQNGDYNLSEEMWQDYADLIRNKDLNNIKKVKEFYNKHGKAEWNEYADWFWHANVFSGLKTNERNFIGSAIFTAMRLPIEFGEVGVDYMRSKITGEQRSKFMKSIGREAYAMFSNISQAHTKAIQSLLWGRAVQDGVDLDWLAKEPPLPETFKRVYGHGMRFMGYLDTFGRTINSQMTLSKMAMDEAINPSKEIEMQYGHMGIEERFRKIMDNPTEEMLEKAHEDAQRGLFQTQLQSNKNPLKALETIEKSLGDNIYTWPASLPFKFMRTTSNLLISSGKLMGAGYFTSAYNAYMSNKYSEDVEVSEAYRDMSEFDLSMALVGSGAMTALLPFAMTGAITGSGPENDSERKEWMDKGWSQYSIMFDAFGERYSLSYRYWAPVNGPIAMVANIGEQFRFNQELPTTDKIVNSFQSTGTFFSNMSLMHGFVSLIDWVRGRRTRRNPFVSSLGSIGIPWTTLMRDFSNYMDPVLRDPDTMTEQFMDQLPYWSSQVDALKDQYGQPIKNESPLGAAQAFTIPFISKVDEGLDEWQEHSRRERRIRDAKRALRNGNPLPEAMTEKSKAFAKAQYLVSELNDTDDKGEAAKVLTQANNQGLLDEMTNKFLTWTIRAENKPYNYGEPMYQKDRELIFYDGDYLAHRIERRLSGEHSPEWRQRKINAIYEFLKNNNYAHLDEQEANRKIYNVHQEVLELSKERESNLFGITKRNPEEDEQPLEPR